MQRSTIYKICTFSGLIPFLALTTLIFVSPAYQAVAKKSLMAYNLAILSFISGSHWGLSLRRAQNVGIIAILSNAITLLGWVTYGVAPFPIFCLLISFYYLILIGVDSLICQSQDDLDWYFWQRCMVTFFVITIQLIAGWIGWKM